MGIRRINQFLQRRGFLFFLVSALVIYVRYYQSILGYFIIFMLFVLLFFKNPKVILSVVIIGLFFTFYRPINTDVPYASTLEVEVVKAKPTYALVRYEKYKFLLYLEDTQIGDRIRVDNPKFKTIRGQGMENLFSFKQYLKYNRVVYELTGNISLIDHHPPLGNKIVDSLLSQIPNSSSYVGMLLFARDDVELDELNEDLVNISAIQLFVISGFHINLIASLLTLIFKKLKKAEVIVNIILVGYLYLLFFPLAALRAYLFRLGNNVNKKYDLPYSRLDILSYLAILFLLIDPLNLFSLSFILTFTVCFFLEFINSMKVMVTKFQLKLLYIFIPFLAILPLTLMINSRIGIINIAMNLLLSPFISIYFLMSLIVIIIPQLDFFVYIMWLGLSRVIHYLEGINRYIEFPHLSEWFYATYYLLLFNFLVALSLKQKGKMNLVGIVCLSVYAQTHPISFPFIAFLDVGQGDSILIHGPNNAYNILIDTGGNRYSDIAMTRLIPYFNSKGIKHLDAVFISHDDFDHNGALKSLQENFKVRRVYQERFYQKTIQGITFKNLNYNFVSEDDNDSSQVLYFNFLGINFLLMGDAGVKVEEHILKTFYSRVDVLKVGHHGSSTSSSETFIKTITPSIAIISCGYQNSYGHPHNSVLATLEKYQIEVYRSDLQGSIIIEKRFYRKIIRTVLV